MHRHFFSEECEGCGENEAKSRLRDLLLHDRADESQPDYDYEIPTMTDPVPDPHKPPLIEEDLISRRLIVDPVHIFCKKGNKKKIMYESNRPRDLRAPASIRINFQLFNDDTVNGIQRGAV